MWCNRLWTRKTMQLLQVEINSIGSPVLDPKDSKYESLLNFVFSL